MRAILLMLLLPISTFAGGPHWPEFDLPRFWILGEGSVHFGTEGSFFFSKANYDANGKKISPSSMEQLRYGQMKFHLGFGFTPSLSLFAQTEMRGIFASNARGSYISDDENYGIGDSFLAARWLLFRTNSANKIYPTEWSPSAFLGLVEGSWLFPAYGTPQNGKPPLGERSTDLTAMFRGVWYASEWFALSGGIGYTYRNFGYSPEIPWQIRTDLMFVKNQSFRLWLKLQSYESTSTSDNVINPTQVDFIPGGSLLFKSDAPTQRTLHGGFGYLLSKQWEVSLGGFTTVSGINTAKGYGALMGIVFRPYQVPELKYEAYQATRKRQAKVEKKELPRERVFHKGIKTIIMKVSAKGNFLKINLGLDDGVKSGDIFHIFEPGNLSLSDSDPVATARVVNVRTNSSFLRVDTLFNPDTNIVEGFEAQRVSVSDE